MKLANGFEIGRFHLKPGVTEAALLQAGRRMDREHLQCQAGFVAHHLVRLDDGLYLDLVFADTRADAERLCRSWQGQAHCEAFMALIDPVSIRFGVVL